MKTSTGPDQTITRLIASCLAENSEVAWREFVVQFQPHIASVILRIARRYSPPNPALVDDLVQETFMRLCKDGARALRRYQEHHEAAIFAYLKAVAASVAMDHFRAVNAEKRRADRCPAPEESIDLYTSVAPNAEQSTLLREIDECIERISENPRDRTIFWLYYRRGLSARDIADLPQIGLSAKGVESCIYRLTKAVRLIIGRADAEKTPSLEGRTPSSTFGEMG